MRNYDSNEYDLNSIDVVRELKPLHEWMGAFIYQFGFLMGVRYGGGIKGGDLFDMQWPNWSAVSWRYYFYRDSLFLSIDISRTPISGIVTRDGWNEYHLLGRTQSLYPWDVRPINNLLSHMMPGAKCTRSIQPCENAYCTSNPQIWANPRGDKWLCDKCCDMYSLPEPEAESELPKARKKTRAEIERAKMTNSLRWQILERDNFTCRACGRNPREHAGVVLHVDHITPIAKGGKTAPDNLQVLCQDCNLAKSDNTVEQMGLWNAAR